MTEDRINELRRTIELTRGAIATIWEYSVSLSQLTIRITWPDRKGNFHLICNACQRMEMLTAWGNLDFTFHASDDGFYRLEDPKGQFFVECGMIRVQRDVEPLF